MIEGLWLERLKRKGALRPSFHESGKIAPFRFLERFSRNDLVVVQEKLRRAHLRAADNGQQSRDLLARNQSQGAAGWAREHRPIRIHTLTNFARILEDEDSTWFHLFGDPFVQDADFRDHRVSPFW